MQVYATIRFVCVMAFHARVSHPAVGMARSSRLFRFTRLVLFTAGIGRSLRVLLHFLRVQFDIVNLISWIVH